MDVSQENLKQIRLIHAQLKAIRKTTSNEGTVSDVVTESYHKQIEALSKIAGSGVAEYKIPQRSFYPSGRNLRVSGDEFRVLLEQAITFIEQEYNVTSEETVIIGGVVKSIQDPELQNRCLDLLDAKDRYDRVINQATQVLEDRIRTIGDPQSKLTGVPLVNDVLNSDFSKTELSLADNPDEHRGYCDIYRGVMMAFRNPTHHKILDKIKKEEAAKVLSFIDVLLSILGNAKKIR